MNISQTIIEYAYKNNGMINASDLKEMGILHGNLDYLVKKGELEKVSRGVYILPDIWEDELYNLQSRFKRGIYNLETALYLYDLTDRTPSHYSMAFPKGYNLKNPKSESIFCTQENEVFYAKGVSSVKTPGGNIVQSYDMERTICDLIRKKNSLDIQLVSESLKRYMRRTDKNIPKLSEYSKILKVDNKLRIYMEVLM